MNINSDVFLEYAKNKHEALLLLIGQKIKHNSFGECTIQEVKIDSDEFFDSRIILQLDHEGESKEGGVPNVKIISIRALNGEIIAEVSAPVEWKEELTLVQEKLINQTFAYEKTESFLQQQEEKRIRRENITRNLREMRQQEISRRKLIEDDHRMREEKAWNEFRLLKEKYGVTFFLENSPLSELNKILINLEEKNYLSVEGEKWLKNNQLYPVLAIYNEREGNISVAGSLWRKANYPERALQISDNLKSYDHYLLTMRGGAYRDLNDLELAKDCALKAIACAPNDYYAYNLLGAILFQQGFAEEGENYFEKAIKLGSKPNEGDIKAALKKAGVAERRAVAEYLLKKDPQRYGWAIDYLW